MSSPTAQDAYTVAVEKAVLSSNLNSTILQATLMGVYAMIYLASVYTYFQRKRKSSRNWLVLSTITMLFLIYVAQTVVNWYLASLAIVIHGDTRQTVSVAETMNPWVVPFGDVCSAVSLSLADALLIWRCYHIWNRSLRAISPGLLLFLAQIAISLAIILVYCINGVHLTARSTKVVDDLITATLFVTAALTSLTTMQISYQIHLVACSGNINRQSHTMFCSILNLLTQSAAVYSLTALMYASVTIVRAVWANSRSLGKEELVWPLNEYTSVFFYFVTGVAPTIMVARASLGSSLDNTVISTFHMSGLEFNGPSTVGQKTTVNPLRTTEISPETTSSDTQEFPRSSG